MHICRFGDFFFVIGKAQFEYMWLDPCYLEKYSGGESQNHNMQYDCVCSKLKHLKVE